ncbi:response regulator transcription factor [Acidovorax sp. NCPPB 4044]|uniref:response regulator transcription factor n=1 Tax=Acidovorax sp. NCPPB 4044 TaxID=2940490 RepID=UPI002304AF02|nr:response regulator transcription factor [Acidovorax sp. NCPPB 4044]MDA8522644.1 response regulator transcription factor [Acidovorax sp. NCPPB 4044]
MRIAVLDDDFILLELIQATAAKAGHTCHLFQEGRELLKALRTETYDLLVVDWHLPDMEGIEVIRAVRAGPMPGLPILFVTRRNAEQDLVAALESGADDFMTKPLRMGEFMARCGALLRRAYPQAASGALVFGRYRFDPEQRSLQVDGDPVELKNKEYELALFLFQNAGRLLSREHLREIVWGDIHDAPSRSLDTHISRLRAKLALVPGHGYVINAVYGVGYRLEVAAPA